MADTLIVTNNFCGDSVGSLQVGTISNGGSPFMYSLTNLQSLTTQSSLLNTFNNLGTGNYELLITTKYQGPWWTRFSRSAAAPRPRSSEARLVDP